MVTYDTLLKCKYSLMRINLRVEDINRTHEVCDVSVDISRDKKRNKG